MFKGKGYLRPFGWIGLIMWMAAVFEVVFPVSGQTNWVNVLIATVGGLLLIATQDKYDV